MNALWQPQDDLLQRLPLTALDVAFARFLQQSQPSADERHAVLAALTSHQYGRGHACLDIQQLAQVGVAALGWAPQGPNPLPPGLLDALALLPWCDGDASPLVRQGTRLYLRRTWEAEQTICRSITQRLAYPVPEPVDLKAALEALFRPARFDSGLPDWQKVACALAARSALTVITGGPGTGKTTTVLRLLALLQRQAMQTGAPLRVALAAPTGKAAARLADAVAQAAQALPAGWQVPLPPQAQTLHRLLQLRYGGRTGEAAPLALDLLVVDEASMIDLELMARLLSALPLSARLVLLGDRDQLASVEAGAVLAQLCEGASAGGYSADTVQWIAQHTGQDLTAWGGAGAALAQQTVMLRHSHRFGADSAIGRWASAVNAGATEAIDALWRDTPLWHPHTTHSVTRLPARHDGAGDLAALARHGWRDWLEGMYGLLSAPEAVCTDAQALAMLGALGRFQVLAALHDGPWGVRALNQRLEQALGLGTAAVAGNAWYMGRPVMVTRNDYNLGLMNGDVGLCLPTERGLRVAFAPGAAASAPGVRWVLPSRLDAVETVWAMTVHKSQGSEFDQVALVLPDRLSPVLTRELLYTGITRAKTGLTLVLARAQVVQQAVAHKFWRSGGLASALWTTGNMPDHED